MAFLALDLRVSGVEPSIDLREHHHLVHFIRRHSILDDGEHVLGSSSHVYLVFEEVTSGSEWGVLLWSPTHSNASSPMHDGKFLFKNM